MPRCRKRVRRDGVARLSGPPLLVLMSLASGAKHGHALLGDIEAFSGVRLGAGTLYGALSRLVEQELIAALPIEERRHPYAITDAGTVLLEEAVAEMAQIVEEGRARLALMPRPHPQAGTA